MTSIVSSSATPEAIGHYQLLEAIGRGGMGLVFRARDTRLERDVAIKCLRTELFEAHYIERFKREALLLAKLNHPNIVQIYDFIDAPDQLALVMELVDGQNLQNYLREHIVPLRQRVQWLTQIAEGLAIAHDSGIIHRDLKAENILINKRGQAKITDLGIAKSQDFNATLTDHIAGSYCSMSPEQAMGEPLDFKSDLFSFGILAYQLLCGAHPFGDTGNKLQIMQRIIAHPPTPPQQHNPDLPGEFVALLGQLLAKDLHKRPDNSHWVAAQFAQLSQLINNTPVSDDTQVLPSQLGANPANQTFSSTLSARQLHTHDHPTFETRFIASAAAIQQAPGQQIKHWLAQNKISAGLGLLTLVILAGVGIWQLQPRAPKYVAVIPPKLTAEGMQEAQQELVKGAVYDAIQQSVIQLEGYYLIPQNEVADINGDNETIQRATAADELIATEILCKGEACTINLSRLVPDENTTAGRLRVENTRTIDLLTDNYLSVATLVQNRLTSLWPQKITSSLSNLNEADYARFLTINNQYRTLGESQDLLDQLDALGSSAKTLAAVQTLYCDIALDLHHETTDSHYLTQAENFIRKTDDPNSTQTYLLNLFNIRLAQDDFGAASNLLNEISALNSGGYYTDQLKAALLIAQGDYTQAIDLYERNTKLKITADTFYKSAIAHWSAGNTTQAKKQIAKALVLSPNFYNALSLSGTISLLEGDLSTAIKSFEKIRQLTPKDTFNLSNLGVALLYSGQYEAALTLFEQAQKLAPENMIFTLNKADALHLMGNVEQANQTYDVIIAQGVSAGAKGKEVFLAESAQAYAHRGRFTEALADLKELEKNAPDHIDNLYTAALIHTLANNKTSALFYIESALDKGINSVWFNPAWFDRLCTDMTFAQMMKKHGAAQRCTATEKIKRGE